MNGVTLRSTRVAGFYGCQGEECTMPADWEVEVWHPHNHRPTKVAVCNKHRHRMDLIAGSASMVRFTMKVHTGGLGLVVVFPKWWPPTPAEWTAAQHAALALLGALS